MPLQKKLNLLHVFAIATGAMISSGLFILPGIAHARAGPAVIVSYLLAGILALPGMLSLAEMTSAMPKAGGDCFSIIRSMGPAVGTVAGLLSWFALAMKSAFALIGLSAFSVLLVNIDPRIIAVVFCLLFLLLNLLGAREAARIQVVFVLGLLGILGVYLLYGLPAVETRNLMPFTPYGLGAVFGTAGFVFVAYTGLLKIASMAEEVKKPGKTIPLGMILSLCAVSLIYTLTVLVTSAVLSDEQLNNTLTPISDGALMIMGTWGRIALSIAAVLAFLTTANAGIMTSARSLVPLSRDKLFPRIFGGIHPRFGTPWAALLITGSLVLASVFLRLRILIEAASMVIILTQILACVSVIILRESRLQNYRPHFHSPLYPWLQILGIIGLVFLIVETGLEALLISAVLIGAGFLAYLFYGRLRGYREYALLHLIESVTAKELTTHLLEAELREIIRERDGLYKDRFDETVERCPVLDFTGRLDYRELFRQAGQALAEDLKQPSKKLFDLLRKRERESSTVISPTIAIPHVVVPGKHTFSLLLARCREGLYFSESAPDVKAVFVLAGSKDERNFHLVSLAAIAQIVQEDGFERRWLAAKGKEALRDLVLLGRRRR